MRRVYHPYTAWEDWQAGMWRTPEDLRPEMEAAARILGDEVAFLAAARVMLRAWPVATEHNFTDQSQNRRSWVGQATCCHAADVPEMSTRLAWWTLEPGQRIAANAVADRVIAEWVAARDADEFPGLFPLSIPEQRQTRREGQCRSAVSESTS